LSLDHTWTHASTHNMTFIGSNENGSVSKTWIVEVTDESQTPSSVAITSSGQTVARNQPFTLTILITPGVSIAGAQFDLLYDSSLATVTSVTEGNLLNQDGASTFFNSGTINNAAGTLTNVYGSILENASVTSQGSMASISMTAGSTTGILELNLTNVVISDADSNETPFTLT
ncbi:MAG: cohesin domain-containing protein, partial [Methanosarcinaceae archaeon]|nr:cohesin domain-containing protein [Methanosarcinaceae archaeon]